MERQIRLLTKVATGSNATSKSLAEPDQRSCGCITYYSIVSVPGLVTGARSENDHWSIRRGNLIKLVLVYNGSMDGR